VIEVLSLYGTAKTTRAKLRSTTTYSTLKIFIVNSSRAIFSDSEISCGPHCTSFHSGRDIQFSFPKQRRLCHESPSAQLSASLRVLHFVPPLRVCIRAPTRGPMSLRGKHCFKNRRSYSQRTTSVLLRRREAYTRRAIFTNSDSRKEQCDDERFLLTFSSVALGPSLPRSCPAVLYNMGTSCTICNACTCIFVKLFRNC
jgi:hypothetical protein